MSLTLGAAWRQAQERIDRLDARLLVQHAAHCSHADLIARPETELAPEQATWLDTLIVRRASGEPLAYLLGMAPFYGHDFVVTPAVLIPRPETELLVELGLEKIAHLAAPRVADLGTGSGIVAICLALARPDATVVGVDYSSEALAVAQKNAKRLGARVDFRSGSWCEPLAEEQFDLIVSNPPYIAHGDPHLELNGLPFEPQFALTDGVAGGNGLACIREIIRQAPRRLVPQSWLLLEHGYDQAPATRLLLARNKGQTPASWRDSAHIERVSGALF